MLKFSKTREVKVPNRGTPGSAGIDFYIPDDFNDGSKFMLHPGHDILIPLGIKCNVPENFALIAFNKSGVATKKKLAVGACVVDSDYMGEVHVHLFNHNAFTVDLCPGDKIIQFLLVPVDHSIPQEVPFEDLYTGKDSERGEGWQGSTGTK